MPSPVNSTPSNANFSNVDGTESYEGPPPASTPSSTPTSGPDCVDSLDKFAKATGRIGDSMRDWGTKKADGDYKADSNDVIDAYTNAIKVGGQAIEDCIEAYTAR